MNRILFSVVSGAAVALISGAALAADVLSQDQTPYVLTLETQDGVKSTVELAALGDLRPVCEHGCRIIMEDGQYVDAKGDDIVHIVGGKIEVYEP